MQVMGLDLRNEADALVGIYHQLLMYEEIIEKAKIRGKETKETVLRLIRKAKKLIIEDEASLYGLLHQISQILSTIYFENFYKE